MTAQWREESSAETALAGDLAPATTRLLDVREFDAWAEGRHILGVASYGGQLSRADIPQAHIDLRQLGDSVLVEVWESATPVSRAKKGPVSYGMNGRVLFGSLSVEPTRGELLSATTERAYAALLDVVREANYPNILRIWNFLPRINADEAGLERYKQFSAGRYEAFSRYGVELHSPPAASALGSDRGVLVVYFVATRHAVAKIENPRQVSAFAYPRQYGPRSPSFSRAARVNWGAREDLYISGTASIVGHETRHEGDVMAQCDETLENLRLVARQARDNDSTEVGQNFSLLKVYLRSPATYQPVRERLEAVLGDQVAILYLRADMCRSALLLEVDAFCFRERP